MKTPKLGLGTVQFGVPYGISNKSGQLSQSDALKALDLAYESGIRVLDTAASYGTAEEIIGMSPHPFRIITKMKSNDSLLESIRTLNRPSVYAVLAHNPSELFTDSRFLRNFLSYREKGLTRKIGLSVYTAEEIDEALALFPFDIIQVPFSVFDQRLYRSGHLQKLKERGIEVHARSTFLQGLLLMDPKELPEKVRFAQKHVESFQNTVKKLGLNAISAALLFSLSFEEIDHVIVGIESIQNLNQLLEIQRATLSEEQKKLLVEEACNDVTLLNPANWTARQEKSL
ncbi:MAG: aldo/keto reductase [Bacteriovoracia bacterium]